MLGWTDGGGVSLAICLHQIIDEGRASDPDCTRQQVNETAHSIAYLDSALDANSPV